jgi:hypothetical protein
LSMGASVRARMEYVTFPLKIKQTRALLLYAALRWTPCHRPSALVHAKAKPAQGVAQIWPKAMAGHGAHMGQSGLRDARLKRGRAKEDSMEYGLIQGARYLGGTL